MQTMNRGESMFGSREITRNTHWVGHRRPGALSHANSYLRRFAASSGDDTDFHLLIDPASSDDFHVVLSNIRQVLGDVDDVDALLLNHQDPDMSASVARLLADHIPRAPVLCSDDTGELIHNYCDVDDDQLVGLEDYPDGLKLPTEAVVRPVATPFCHDRGATMLYDPETRVLFSGELFSGLTNPGNDELYADEDDWIGLRAFHQMYMPSQSAVRRAIGRIRELDAPVDVIAPRRGRLIVGEFVDLFVERLADLRMGIDVADEHAVCDRWTSVATDIVEVAIERLDASGLQALLEGDDELADVVAFDGGTPTVRTDRKQQVEYLIRRLGEGLDHGDANVTRYEAARSAAEHRLPTPRLEIDETMIDADGRGGRPSPFLDFSDTAMPAGSTDPFVGR